MMGIFCERLVLEIVLLLLSLFSSLILFFFVCAFPLYMYSPLPVFPSPRHQLLDGWFKQLNSLLSCFCVSFFPFFSVLFFSSWFFSFYFQVVRYATASAEKRPISSIPPLLLKTIPTLNEPHPTFHPLFPPSMDKKLLLSICPGNWVLSYLSPVTRVSWRCIVVRLPWFGAVVRWNVIAGLEMVRLSFVIRSFVHTPHPSHPSSFQRSGRQSNYRCICMHMWMEREVGYWSTGWWFASQAHLPPSSGGVADYLRTGLVGLGLGLSWVGSGSLVRALVTWLWLASKWEWRCP